MTIARRTPVRKESPKREAQRLASGQPFTNSTVRGKRAAVRKANPKRKASEWARVYHSRARVEMVKSMTCEAFMGLCGETTDCDGPMENAHTGRGAGMGRKAGYATIIPLCRHHHREYHTRGAQTFAEVYCIDYARASHDVEDAWQREADWRASAAGLSQKEKGR